MNEKRKHDARKLYRMRLDERKERRREWVRLGEKRRNEMKRGDGR